MVSEPFRPRRYRANPIACTAKRYLCYADDKYLALLSPASVQSLELQGGPYTAAEARTLEVNPFLDDALSLRRWDDAPKVPGLTVPSLDDYHDLIESLLLRESRQ